MVMGGMCVQSITTIRTIIRLPEALSFTVAMVMVVMGGMCVQSTYHGHTHYYQATTYVIVINCLRLSCYCH